MLNRTIIMGRITKELEIRQSQSGTAVLRFTVAVERPSKGDVKQTDFINCVAFGQRAEFISRYFGKGRMIALEGSIKTGSYDDRDGKRVYTTDIIVDSVSFTGEPKIGGNSQRESSNSSLPDDYEEIISDDGVPW